MKLSKAQMRLLSELPTNCVRYFKPSEKLVEFGLAKWRDATSDNLEITDCGRAALRDAKERKE